MPLYEYRAIDNRGKKLKGFIDAANEIQARHQLKSSGKFPVSLKENQSNRRKDVNKRTGLTLFERIRPDEVNVMTRQLATLLGAAIPLVQALSSLVDQTENRALKRVIAQLRESVSEGSSLTSSLGAYPKLFSKVYINMVRAGEASGSLDVVLERLADFGEKQQTLRGKMRAALVYPMFMAVIGSGILFFLITYVVPNVSQVFEEMNRVLPLSTRVLIGTSEFLQNHWLLFVVLFFLALAAVRGLVRLPAGRSGWDLLKLKLPVFGPVFRKILLARFASTMSSLLSSGVGLIPSIEISQALVENVRVAEVLEEAMADIQKGKSMASSLAGSAWFPPMYVQMIEIGEQSGRLEAMLGKIAVAYERDVENSITAMTSLIEPLMISIMGGVVGFIVLSILLPIFEMNQLVG